MTRSSSGSPSGRSPSQSKVSAACGSAAAACGQVAAWPSTPGVSYASSCARRAGTQRALFDWSVTRAQGVVQAH